MATLIKKEDEVTITRTFDAPREAVWKAWTDPERFMHWWGPKNFTAPVSRMDLRAGGKYLNCMKSPEGQEYWSTGVYREIVPLERIVCTDSFADEKGNVVPASHYNMPGEWPLELLVTVLFEDAAGKTKMTLRHQGIPEGTMSEQTRTGWNESFDKLEELVKAENALVVCAQPGKQEIVLTRIFDAPRELVFKTQTDPSLIPRWWGPKRYATVVDRMEPRAGGSWRFLHRDAAGNEYAFRGVYHEVKAPERIVYTFEFEGMPGHVSLETVTFEKMGNRTKATDKVVFQSVEDRDGMLKSGMEEGARETMDRFAEVLAKARAVKKAA